jgi:CheY-like chemotaxis protein
MSEAALKTAEQPALRVLVVDDEKDLANITAEKLRRIGCESHMSTNADEAIDKILNNKFDLLILDWTMPGLSGGDTLQSLQDKILQSPALREKWGLNVIPVVIYSGNTLQEMKFPQVKNFIIVDYWSKSSHIDQITASAKSLVSVITSKIQEHKQNGRPIKFRHFRGR